ncbi:MAG: KpsF/GutQ family sugar-phosphate isomerase [Methyloprofundus sp.]|nr:KpsF/GutQ family sugar-phosphate isomerase [Methyloprofundus sp.]
MNSLQIAQQVIKTEAEQIANLLNLLDEHFEQAVNAVLHSKGKVIISGMGKSGIIGKKICATLASTGTPSFYLHPAEAYHGDLGMIEPQDIVLLISNSGETDEVLKLIPFLKEQGNITLSMSGNDKSTLAKNTHHHLSIAVKEEACPLQLAPTCSTTATLVMGDALAVALMQMRQFKDEHFARFHPGGSLGRRLLMTVKDVMQTQNLPQCSQQTKVHDVVHGITQGKCGLVVVLQNKEILGVVTDGDIRRAMEMQESTFFSLTAADLMSTQPKAIRQTARLTEVSEIMEQHKINSVLVVDDQQVFVGVVQMYDLGI